MFLTSINAEDLSKIYKADRFIKTKLPGTTNKFLVRCHRYIQETVSSLKVHGIWCHLIVPNDRRFVL